MRALIYTRVSHDPKKKGRSVAEQKADCLALCDREGWDVVEVVTENDRSASRYAKKARPEWSKVKKKIANGGADVLVTWEASRAQRDLAAYVELRDLCRSSGVLWSYSGKTYDLDDVNDAFSAGIDALVSEREAEDARKRIKRAMRANAAKGRPHGRLLYGYRRVYDPETRELVAQEPDPVQAPIVQEMATRTLAGESAFRIAEDLNARGIPAPKVGSWDSTRIKRLLTNPAMAGYRVHQGEVVGDGDWTPVLDRDTFARLANVYADPNRDKFRGGRDVKYLLSGIARCGECGGRLYRAHDRGKLTYSCKDGKGHVSRRMNNLDAYVTSIVIGLLEREDLNLGADDEPAVAEARADAAQLRQRLEDAVGEFTAGNLSATTLARVEGDLLPKIEACERRARAAMSVPVVADLVGSDVAERWDALDVEQQRQVVAALVDVVVCKATAKGKRGLETETIHVAPRV